MASLYALGIVLIVATVIVLLISASVIIAIACFKHYVNRSINNTASSSTIKKKLCPKCGAALASTANFCPVCGHRFF